MTNEREQKEIAFYSALVNGWLTTRLEHDKTILTLSAGGVGLLVTLLTTLGVRSNTVFVLFVFATLAFLVAIIAVVVVLKKNASHLEKVVKGTESSDPVLRFLDGVASYSFVTAVLFTLAIGLAVGASSLSNSEEKTMASKDDVKKMIESNTETLKKSWDGVSTMRPSQNENGTGSTQSPSQPQPQNQDPKK